MPPEGDESDEDDEEEEEAAEWEPSVRGPTPCQCRGILPCDGGRVRMG